MAAVAVALMPLPGRVAVVAAAVLVVVSLFLPVPGAERLVPVEMKWFGLVPEGTRSIFAVYSGIESSARLFVVLFVATWLPIALVAAAAALAWPAPRGVWDTRGCARQAGGARRRLLAVDCDRRAGAPG